MITNVPPRFYETHNAARAHFRLAKACDGRRFQVIANYLSKLANFYRATLC